MIECFLGIDIGTSSIRAVLFDVNGRQLSFESNDCAIFTSGDGKAEVDPDYAFTSTISVIKSCIEKSGAYKHGLAGMGLSCHMHSLMAVDINGSPLTNASIWADTRAGLEAKHIELSCNISDLYFRTGCRVQHPMYPLSKLLRIKNSERDCFDKAYKFITLKEYILFRLYGSFIVDYTLAASQGYFNINSQKWDDFILKEILGISADKLSEAVECTHILKGMKPEFAGSIGIDPDTPMVIGSGDGIMANLGCGVTDDTSLSSTIGTSGAIRTSVNSPLLDPQQRTWCYSFTKDTWVAGGAINNGGIVLKWLRENFNKQFEADASENKESIYKVFDRFVSEIAPGSDGLIFLPCLTGERSPDWNPNVRGLMFGLDFSHSRKHIIRAAMEGVMYRLYSVFEAMSEVNSRAVKIKANGGYVKSNIWLQIQADIFNKEIHVCNTGEASALGAAYLTMIALGAVSNIKQLIPGMKAENVIIPDAGNHAVYSKLYKHSKEIYENIYGNKSGGKT